MFQSLHPTCRSSHLVGLSEPAPTTQTTLCSFLPTGWLLAPHKGPTWPQTPLGTHTEFRLIPWGSDGIHG